MATSIAPTLSEIQQQIASIDIQAKKDQSVTSSQFDDIKAEILALQGTDGLDDATQAKIKSLSDDLNTMQGLTQEDQKGTSTSNAAWGQSVADVNKLLEDMGVSGTLSATSGGQGPGTAYKGLSAEDAKIAGLPDAIAKIQNTGDAGLNQQVNKVQDGAGKSYYVTSGNGGDSKNYTVYDDTGKSMGTMSAPGALGLNDGTTWLALSDKGISGAWTTTDPKSLDAKTQLFDLNGAAENNGQIVPRGTNSGGVAATTAGATTGTAGGSTKLADSAHSVKDNEAGGKVEMNANGAKFWAGSTSSTGTVYADVTTPDSKGGNFSGTNNEHWVKLKNEAGDGITPPELNRGQYGSMSFTNGSSYVASEKGYFMISGGQAKNIVTGDLITDPKQVADIAGSAGGYTAYKQTDIEAQNKRNTEASAQAAANAQTTPT